jgi:hypothetical protein
MKKNIKLYEGFIENIKNDFARTLYQRRQRFEDCLQILKDEYGVDYYEQSLSDVFTQAKIEYMNVEDIDKFPLSDTLIDDIIKTVKRLRQYEDIDIEGRITMRLKGSNYKKSVFFSTNDWYDTPNPTESQRRYIKNPNDIKALFDERMVQLMKAKRELKDGDDSHDNYIVSLINISIC